MNHTLKKRNIISFLLCICLFATMWITPVHAFSENLSADDQYGIIISDGNNMGHLEEVTDTVFQDWYRIKSLQRSGYANGKAVYSLSGTLVAYVTLYYNTTISGGRRVFVFDKNLYLGANPQNKYNGSATIISASPDMIKVKYSYANILGDSGYRTLVYYP